MPLGNQTGFGPGGCRAGVGSTATSIPAMLIVQPISECTTDFNVTPIHAESA
jgi:hypothetical protein